MGKKFLHKPLFLYVLITAVILLVIMNFLLMRPSNYQVTTTRSISETTPNTTGWQTYTNSEAGFSFKYPSSVILSENPNATKQTLTVTVDKVATLPDELPLSLGRIDALSEKARLEKNEGEELIKIGALNGQTQTILSQFEVCSVLFTRQLTFFPGEYRVILTLVGPQQTIITEMPEFFSSDKTNCGSQPVWNRDKIDTFEPMLKRQQGRGMAQEWYDTFDQIVQTVSLTK